MGQGLRMSVGRGGWYWPFCKGGVLLLRLGSVSIVGSTVKRLRRRQEVRKRLRIGGKGSLSIWGQERLGASFCRLKLPEETTFGIMSAGHLRVLTGEEE